MRTQEIRVRAVAGVLVFAVWSAIAAHIKHEDIEQRAIGDLAVDPARLGLGFAHRHVFMEGPGRARRDDQIVLLDVLLRDEFRARVHRFARPPIVENFVIVPLREHRDFGVERAEILVEQVVFIVAAEFCERLGRLRLVFGNDVLPDLAVRHFLLGVDRPVGIDVVAVVNEKIRLVLEDSGVSAHAAARLVDTPALADGIARPHEADRALVARRGAEAANHRLAGNGRRRQILRADAIEDVLAGGQILHQCLGGEIAFRQRVDIDAADNIFEAVGGGEFDLQARRPVGTGPYHAGIDGHIAGLDAVADGRPVTGAAEKGRSDAAETRKSRGCGGRGEKATARGDDRTMHVCLRCELEAGQ